MKDFSLEIYEALLVQALCSGYQFQTFEQFIENPKNGKVLVLRHDVDRLPDNAYKMAQIERNLGIEATYFFRIVKSVWEPMIIQKIIDFGHEVAYHYEDLSIVKGDYVKAIKHFEYHLSEFRRLYSSKTICMHGSPMSKWANRKIWEKYSYRDYGIIAEPYFDVDYTKTLYITDTGRTWDNSEFNIRDRVNSGFDLKVKNTYHLIKLFKDGKMPKNVIINTHPQRWFNPGLNWYKELIMQNFKNTIKRLIVMRRQ